MSLASIFLGLMIFLVCALATIFVLGYLTIKGNE